MNGVLQSKPVQELSMTYATDHFHSADPARLPIAPRRRSQEHRHFARRGEHFACFLNGRRKQLAVSPAGHTGCKPMFQQHRQVEALNRQIAKSVLEPLRTSRRPENFAENDCVALSR
jgi:hypothetical protein